jgi:putative DNA primase/helicase
MSRAEDVKRQARGKWPSILAALGIDKSFLNGRNGPCPACGGTDRFRFTNKDGDGQFICSPQGAGCGSGDGFDLLQRVHGWAPGEAFRNVREVVGGADASPTPRGTDPAAAADGCRRLWTATRTIGRGDLAATYLGSRGLSGPFPDDMRFAASCRLTRVPGIDALPALVTMFRCPDGSPGTLHRTYLAPDGGGKADIPSPRRFMPGDVPKGGAMRVAPYTDTLGIAEGVETARAVLRDKGIPCWAAGDAGRLGEFVWPADVKHLVIFGDNDPHWAGQLGCATLANRIARTKGGPTFEVVWPDTIGTDWLDVGNAARGL